MDERKEWRCFHCDEVFTTTGGAADHFGDGPWRTPGCLIRVQLGDERGLQMALRKAEAWIDDLLRERDSEIVSTESYYARLNLDLRGWPPFRKCNTIKDVFDLYDSMEGRALAAEERLALTESVGSETHQ